MDDLRRRNQYFELSSPHAYLAQYSVTLAESLRAVSPDALSAALKTLRRARTIFVCGNGGSAAIADHWCADFTKGLSQGPAKRTPRVRSLVGSTALLTALANDNEYADVFRAQLELEGVDWLDCLVCVSASGNSPNVVRAAEYAQTHATPVIGFTGFDGGKLRELADISLHIPVPNYGVVEDAHSALMHTLAQFWWQSLRP